MLEITSMHDLPARITLAHVAVEVAKYPRRLVMLEDQGGWAIYGSDGKRRTERRRSWNAALLDLAAFAPMVTRV
jgi:hypothetical protein